jgi:hypothetical protein
MMSPLHEYFFNINRRQLIQHGTAGGLAMLGATAVRELFADEPPRSQDGDQVFGLPHFPAKAKRVIYLFQEGGPSQLDTFDYKPQLEEWFDKELPESVRGSQRLTGMTSGQARLPVVPTMFPFRCFENQQDGLWVSELLSQTGAMANEICVISSMVTEQINHGPGMTFMQTGHQLPGRPSIGAWLSYGLGNASRTRLVRGDDQSGQPDAGPVFCTYGAGFFQEHQGVNRAAADPVLFLNNPRDDVMTDITL